MRFYRIKLSAFALGLLLSFAALAQALGNKTALVIIDMQPYFVVRGGNDKEPKNVEKVNQILANQSRLIEEAKAAGTPIVFIEYEGYGDTNSVLKTALGDYQDTKTFTKNYDGMFDDPRTKEKLQIFFNTRGIGNLVITGANGGACVEESIRGSLDNNYNVVAVAPGIADFNYSEFIFPYDHRYEFFEKPSCVSCTFKEADDMESAETAISAHASGQSSSQVDESRETGKDIPLPKKGPNSSSNSATLQ